MNVIFDFNAVKAGYCYNSGFKVEIDMSEYAQVRDNKSLKTKEERKRDCSN